MPAAFGGSCRIVASTVVIGSSSQPVPMPSRHGR
jgi:hypothetical protein